MLCLVGVVLSALWAWPAPSGRGLALKATQCLQMVGVASLLKRHAHRYGGCVGVATAPGGRGQPPVGVTSLLKRHAPPYEVCV